MGNEFQKYQDNKRQQITRVSALLQMIYSLDCDIAFREGMDENKNLIEPLVFNKMYHSNIDTLVIGIAILFDAQSKNNNDKTLSVIVLLDELKDDYIYGAKAILLRNKIIGSHVGKEITIMRNKCTRGHFDEKLFDLVKTKNVWNFSCTNKQLREYLALFKIALLFVASCMELDIEKLKNQAKIQFDVDLFKEQKNVFFKNLKK